MQRCRGVASQGCSIHSVEAFALLSWLTLGMMVARVLPSLRRSPRVRTWPTFCLEMLSGLVYLHIDDLSYEKKPRPADPVDDTTPAGMI